MTHTLKILDTHYINHDVKKFVVEKPLGFTYLPGQAVAISINKPEWQDQLRPFTFTSLQEWDYLEFMIKIYDDHKGVTHELGKVNAGAELLLHDVFGSIQYKGPGIFIAGGAGITPFIAIFRALFHSGKLKQNGLIYSNKSAEDIIIQDELTRMLGPNYINVFTKQGVIGFMEKRIDKKYLVETIRDFDRNFYVCGPDAFVKEINTHLISLGVAPESLVFEH